MDYLKHCGFVFLMLLILLVAGCGGDDDDNELVRLDLENLGQLTGPFQYAAWVEANGNIGMLDTFNTQSDNTAAFSRFSLIGTLETGDRVFVTIEPDPDPEPNIPSNTRVLDGTISGNTAVLTFPRLQGFANAEGFVTVPEGNRQILAEYTGLPDLSDLNFIYQGFLVRNGIFTPLTRFTFNQVPVTDTVTFDVTTAQYFLSIEPVLDPDPNRPYTMRPFFTNGNLLPEIRQRLTRSSLTPNDPNFFFPSGVATIQ